MAIAHINGLSIHHERRGSGPRLLLISGTGSDLRRKPGVFDMPFVHHFDLLSYDHRGMGQSGLPAAAGSMADFAKDAAGLLDAVGWDTCSVVGISFGGMVAQELALRHPARVERLVLACTSSGGQGGASFPLHEWHGLPLEAYAQRMLRQSDLRRDDDWVAAHPAAWNALMKQTLDAYQVGADEPGREEGARQQLEARRQHNTYERLPQLGMPVLIAGGQFDGIAPPPRLEALHARIPDSTLRMYEGGHLFFYQDRQAFPDMIDFLQAVRE
ncbi:alpha/beta hydrolase [Hydrogenophaga sp. 5NK40-0174]|uniref:alpha/beta fold hydrolase n=1 Tax=Hydrogenophaga sp. 5NK40-0174 TaxID=3127649 RepID=UPI00310A0D23